jgi:hypothetical protein
MVPSCSYNEWVENTWVNMCVLPRMEVSVITLFNCLTLQLFSSSWRDLDRQIARNL